MRKFIWAVFLLVVPAVFAQDNGEERLGGWYMYFGTNKVSDRLSIHTEAQFRFWEAASNFNQLLLRTGLNYHINPSAIATIGYGYISTDGTFEEFPGEENVKENRLFLQFILKNEVSKFQFEHRYRFEQRFIDFGTSTDTRYRARYRLQITFALTTVLFINMYNEIFLNLQGNVFDQNRLYGALGFHLAPNMSVQIGYLKNHFPSAHFDRLQLGFFYNPDFRNKSKATP
ncbi:MAG: DUF2490 domain-containing protein [Flavobacteriaceae bacterium]